MESFDQQQSLRPDTILGPEGHLHRDTLFLTFAKTFELSYHQAFCYVKYNSDHQQLNVPLVFFERGFP